MFQFCCRSIFSNFSIENILSENIAEEKNEKVMDVNVLKKIKQEKIELLGNILLKYLFRPSNTSISVYLIYSQIKELERKKFD